MNQIIVVDESGEILTTEEIVEKTQNQLLVKSYQIGVDYPTAKVAFTMNEYIITFGDKSGRDKLTNDIRKMVESDKQTLLALLQE